MKKKRLGEILRERGYVSPSDLNQAIQDQHGKLLHLGELLLQRGSVSRENLSNALSEMVGVPYVDCSQIEVASEVLQRIPGNLARSAHLLPLQIEGTNKLIVAMSDPQNLRLIDELRFKTGMNVIPRLAFQTEIDVAIDRLYGVEKSAEPEMLSETPSPQDGAPEMEFISFTDQKRNVEAMREMQTELNQKSKTTPAVQLVATMIRDAAKRGASDIHVEPQTGDTSVRFRVDGMLRNYSRIPRALQNTVVSRIKILSDMDISERRVPQDGRFLVKIMGRRFDLRVSSLPTQYGETVVLRLLDSGASVKDFSILGCPPVIGEKLKRLLSYPQGMILVTGPTGSGKSTTLYSALNFARKPSINIITVEDPVEYEIPGLNQVQVNNKAGLTFATCLRSILRQDPNVIMVGEIRDKETAEISMKAAQTGHLVLSTLHTNDSISAVTRILDLGIAGYQISSSLTAVLAQRLIRQLCHCRKVVPSTPEFIAQLREVGVSNPPENQSIPNGCEECDLAGYKGRIGIYELLVFDDAIRSAVRNELSTDEIRSLARRNGMRLMHEYALEHVCNGLTTLEEVQRVVPFEEAAPIACAVCQRELSAAFQFCPFCGAKGASEEVEKRDLIEFPDQEEARRELASKKASRKGAGRK